MRESFHLADKGRLYVGIYQQGGIARGPDPLVLHPFFLNFVPFLPLCFVTSFCSISFFLPSLRKLPRHLVPFFSFSVLLLFFFLHVSSSFALYFSSLHKLPRHSSLDSFKFPFNFCSFPSFFFNNSFYCSFSSFFFSKLLRHVQFHSSSLPSYFCPFLFLRLLCLMFIFLFPSLCKLSRRYSLSYSVRMLRLLLFQFLFFLFSLFTSVFVFLILLFS